MRASRLIGITAVTVTPALFSAPVSAQFKADFSNGSIPKTMRTENVGGVLPDSECYKHGFTESGWTVDRVGITGYAAVSPTFNGKGESVENRLTIPSIEIGEDFILRWKACSVYPDFPDSYRVEIRAGGNEWQVLAKVNDEEPEWTHRALSLNEFTGKTVDIAFTADSDNGYLLAIDDIFCGISEECLELTDLTLPYFGTLTSGRASVTVRVTNIGSPLAEGCIFSITTSDGYECSTTLSESLPTGESRDVVFEVPMTNDTLTEYTVKHESVSGNINTVNGCFYSSDYVRLPVVDEGTGTWCNNCPAGMVELESFLRKMRGAAVSLVTHSGDRMANDAYWNGLGFYAVPYFMLNRDKSTQYSNTEKFETSMYRPTYMLPQISSLATASDGSLDVGVKTWFSRQTENFSDRYRLAYVLTSEFHRPDEPRFRQENNSTKTSARQFYFLPSKIPAVLMKYHNVTLTSETAFTGMENSLPASPETGIPYTHSFNIPLPDMAESFINTNLIVYIIDTESGIIENATRIHIDEDALLGIISPVADNIGFSVRADSNGVCRLDGITHGEHFHIESYDLSGRRTAHTEGVFCGNPVTLKMPKGPAVIRAVSDSSTAVCKVVIR